MESVEGKQDALRVAQDATDQEHRMSLLSAVRLYPKAIGWSILLSTAVIMEGYDLLLMGSLYAQPAFKKKYGEQLADGTYQIPAPWQAGLSNGASVGSIIGLIINGYVSERIGFRKTMMAALSIIIGIIFIPFFAPSLEVLLVGQILIGIPWGIFQTLTTAYAAEVTPTHLRAYLTTYVNLCWVFGQLCGSGVLRAMLLRNDQWAYRIPFGLQWMWPVPLIIGISFAPESPWWLVRKNRLEDAKAALLRLTSVDKDPDFDVDKTVTLMAVTVAQEKELGTGTRYVDLFRGVDLRRTYVACACWMIQILSGSGLRSYSTYFYQQAGLATDQAFNMSIAGYALGIFGVICSWALLPKVGRRTMYLGGLVCLMTSLLIVGILGAIKQHPTSSIAWAIGSILLIYTFFYDVSVGPVCYSLVSELPAVRLRSKTIVLARASYNALNIVSNVITPYMLNPSAWNWGAKAGFFYAGTCLLSLVFTFFCIPEPKDRTFAELNILFQKKTNARKFKGEKVDLYDVQIGNFEDRKI
ncbi:sugar transporter [Rhizodiscina lignyota]|uniref:Sugar transporter n=1 Tax=Rhizodiscina lignyota TaxID=1504668 RepID=A0A9P4I263_9PEZI|nr:sugar transporter [Rhizodiscina lignyota]